MSQVYYAPLKLNQTNRYAGYQFHARVHVDGMPPSDAFRFLILSVCHWIRSKVPEEDRKVPELSLPEAEEYASVSEDAFLPYHFSVGYALDITPLMESGIWALRLKEPDRGVEGGREAVPGRFFTTRVGLRLNDKGYTELGIRIDITDPASEEKELPFAFRPGFVRSLAIQPSVCFEQVREMQYGQPERITAEVDYKRFLYMLENEDNQMPLVVFTHARPGEKKPAAGMKIEDFLKTDPLKTDPLKALLPSAVPGMDFPAMVSASKEAKVKFGEPAPAAPEPPVLLFDAEAFSRSAFAYARTYVMGDRYLEKFRSRIKKDFSAGDILVCGSRKFRGGATVISCPGRAEYEVKKAYNDALLASQSYSKHKAPYSFGTVVFEAEARKMEQQRELQRILESGSLEEKERYDRLVRYTEELNGVINSKDEKISRLEKQCAEEFDRGVAFRDQEYAALEEENTGLKRDLADQQDQIEGMQDSFRQAREILNVLDQMRSVGTLPQTNEDVVRYFRLVFRDRMDFTARGASSAAKCDLKAETLWEVLYTAATGLADAFREKQGNLSEEDVTRIMGCEMSFKEGSMTRKQNDLMRLREDEYEGKSISVEPHLKLKFAKGDAAQHQRVHFCYLPALRRIVIGYVGDHLDSAATRYVK